MQAEILHLERELHIIETEDQGSDDQARASLRISLFNLKESSGKSYDAQWRKVLEIREKLDRYSEFST